MESKSTNHSDNLNLLNTNSFFTNKVINSEQINSLGKLDYDKYKNISNKLEINNNKTFNCIAELFSVILN